MTNYILKVVNSFTIENCKQVKDNSDTYILSSDFYEHFKPVGLTVLKISLHDD